MDPLTQTIALLRPRALLWKELHARGDWAIRFPANRSVVFSLVAQGLCVFQTAGRAPKLMGEGDFVLMTAPGVWSLGRDAGSIPIDFRADAVPEGRPAVLGDPAAGSEARLLGGRFAFDETQAALLKGLSPALIEVDAGDEAAGRLRGVLGLLRDEALSDRPGRGFVIERLLELMLVEAMRQGGDAPPEGHRNLLAALSEPRIAAALRALHDDVRRPWTVGQLAAVAGMSRSVFAERFAKLLGRAPMDYLIHWRMALAKDALRRGAGSLAEIADHSGYRSFSAFSAAFSRTVGCPPSKFSVRRFEDTRDD